MPFLLLPFFLTTQQQGNDEGDPQDGGGEDLNQLKGELTKLKETVKALSNAKAELEQKLGEYEGELLSEDYLKWKEGKSQQQPREGELDFETASTKEIVDYLEKKHKADLESAVNELSSRLEETQDKLALALARLDVEMTALRHPDFWNYKDKIQKLAEQNPSWSAEKCYKQAKIEAKLEEEEKAAKEREKAEKERKVLSEKGGIPPSAMQGKQLSPEEAAELAYRTVFGNQQ